MKKILLTGATGYVGGRLLSKLQDKNLFVICLARRPEALEFRLTKNTSIIKGDIQKREDLVRAMQGVDAAFYLIHSMGESGNFETADRNAALNFASAAKECGVKRIIYLGGLGDSNQKLSSHLRSRQEVGKILRTSGAQVIEFRASVVIGSGSLSFELVRALVDRLPILIMPKWVRVPAQPIWINDLLEYLEASLQLNEADNRIFEIGGADIVSYRGIMEEYAKQRGLKRLMINLPVLTPYLSSLWLGLVTPVFARTGRCLVESLKHATVVQDDSAKTCLKIDPVGLSRAVQMSIRNEDKEYAETRWSDALSSAGELKHYGGVRFGRRIVESSSIKVNCTAQQAFSIIESIGGKKGWKFANWIWKIRGYIDLLVGGVGLRRGRRDPNKLNVGDTLDWWRVEEKVSQQSLLLVAEMKVPGRAWLKFEVTDSEEGVVITQTAIFDPKGVGGLLYWYGLFPIHAYIFSGMLRKISVECSDL